ncbi:helix-turn-helix domain-containing protein [Salinigranum marinum]|uniref:winged helix-turn-helix transcriptional regulator n=1 Tax=Salinigranum marinum TaxID=1515595 RepID=UPI002989F7AE|nr:helix-turn-helix domain-containing protein [Salinigranum marinum]
MQRNSPPRTGRSDGVVTPARSQEALVSITDVVGRKWQPVIVYHLHTAGPHGFGELQDRIDGISPKMLSTSLTELDETHALVERRVISETPFRVEYALTAAGESLGSVVEDLRLWGLEHCRS